MSKCVCLCVSAREIIQYILKGSLLLVFNFLTWLVGGFLVVGFGVLGWFCFILFFETRDFVIRETHDGDTSPRLIIFEQRGEDH